MKKKMIFSRQSYVLILGALLHGSNSFAEDVWRIGNGPVAVGRVNSNTVSKVVRTDSATQQDLEKSLRNVIRAYNKDNRINDNSERFPSSLNSELFLKVFREAQRYHQGKHIVATFNISSVNGVTAKSATGDIVTVSLAAVDNPRNTTEAPNDANPLTPGAVEEVASLITTANGGRDEDLIADVILDLVNDSEESFSKNGPPRADVGQLITADAEAIVQGNFRAIGDQRAYALRRGRLLPALSVALNSSSIKETNRDGQRTGRSANGVARNNDITVITDVKDSFTIFRRIEGAMLGSNLERDNEAKRHDLVNAIIRIAERIPDVFGLADRALVSVAINKKNRTIHFALTSDNRRGDFSGIFRSKGLTLKAIQDLVGGIDYNATTQVAGILKQVVGTAQRNAANFKEVIDNLAFANSNNIRNVSDVFESFAFSKQGEIQNRLSDYTHGNFVDRKLTVNNRSNSKPEMIAHRGLVDLGKGFVENSLSAMLNALDHGIKALEIDVRATKDLRVIPWHDQSVGRMGGHIIDGNLKVSDINFDQLRGQKLMYRNPTVIGDEYLETRDTIISLFEMLTEIWGKAKDMAASSRDFDVDDIDIYIDAKDADSLVVIHNLDRLSSSSSEFGLWVKRNVAVKFYNSAKILSGGYGAMVQGTMCLFDDVDTVAKADRILHSIKWLPSVFIADGKKVVGDRLMEGVTGEGSTTSSDKGIDGTYAWLHNIMDHDIRSDILGNRNIVGFEIFRDGTETKADNDGKTIQNLIRGVGDVTTTADYTMFPQYADLPFMMSYRFEDFRVNSFHYYGNLGEVNGTAKTAEKRAREDSRGTAGNLRDSNIDLVITDNPLLEVASLNDLLSEKERTRGNPFVQVKFLGGNVRPGLKAPSNQGDNKLVQCETEVFNTFKNQ